MFTDNHTFVNFCTRLNEKNTAILNRQNSVKCGYAVLARYEYAFVTTAYLAAMKRSIAVKCMVHNSITTSQCQEVCTVSNQTASWDQELKTDLSASVIDHIDHLGFA
ncbi:hypothetical protein D3C72_1607350 [compost metagenome]